MCSIVRLGLRAHATLGALLLALLSLLPPPAQAAAGTTAAAFPYDALSRTMKWPVTNGDTAQTLHDDAYQDDGNSNRTQIIAVPAAGLNARPRRRGAQCDIAQAIPVSRRPSRCRP